VSINPHGDIPEFRQRHRYLIGVVVVSFLILLGRLWQMQVVQGEEYLRKSTDNFVQERRIPTVRGLIFDRKGRPLVSNRPSWDVAVTPRFITPAALDHLAEHLSLTPEAAQELKHKVGAVVGPKRFDPHILVRDITRDQLAVIEAHREDLPGISIVARAHRNYLHGNLAAHVLGYMNEVTAEELARDKDKHYQPGDQIGRFGVERMFETALAGAPGREWVVVDARGRRKGGDEAAELLKGTHSEEPRPGDNLTLTIDIEVQRLTERALRAYPSGAAVVLEVETGRVLASASKPAFEPNLLTGRLNREDAARLINDPYRPLLDKVFRENYYPGSTYKVIAATAALEEHQVNPDEKIMCKGAHAFGRRSFKCSHAHGKMDMHQAIAQSCNVYFYTIAEVVGMDAMAHYARLYGLGSPTGIGLNGEVGGFIPTKDWYAQRKQPFRVGFTLNSAIGQGNVKATPIQIASLYATIANGGTLYLPQIVEQVESADGVAVQRFTPRVRRRISLATSTLALLRAGLHDVVADDKGTGREARLPTISISGKTGTAQVNRKLKKGKIIWLEDHSWFAAYAPSERPAIAVAVLIEHGGKAAKVAAPIASEIIAGYFRYVAPAASQRAQAAGVEATP
jgi:penicillin-binding protein 2